LGALNEEPHCLAPERARELIRRGAAEAVGRAGELQPWRLEPPIELELTFYRSGFAGEAAARFGVRRVDARTVRRVVENAAEVCRF
jgi:D-aminopeptidase